MLHQLAGPSDFTHGAPTLYFPTEGSHGIQIVNLSNAYYQVLDSNANVLGIVPPGFRGETPLTQLTTRVILSTLNLGSSSANIANQFVYAGNLQQPPPQYKSESLGFVFSNAAGTSQVTIAAALPAGTNSIGAVTESNLDSSVGSTGSSVPSTSFQVAGSDGTDLRTLLTDTDGTSNTHPTKLGAFSPANPVTVNNVSESSATAFGSFTAASTGLATVLVSVSAAATLSLTTLGQTSALNGGTSLSASEWYTFQFPVVAGQAYSFQVSASVTVSLQVVQNTTA